MIGKIFEATDGADRITVSGYRNRLSVVGEKYDDFGDLTLQTWNVLSREQAMDLRNALDVWISVQEAGDS